MTDSIANSEGSEDKVLLLATMLGDKSPADFRTEDEINTHFDDDNIRDLFPDDDFEDDEIDEACHTCITEWKSSRAVVTEFESARVKAAESHR